MTEETTNLGVSRRTLAKGAAWTVPAAAVIAAAPAYAKSGCDYTITVDPALSCKKANQNDYRLTFRVSATSSDPRCAVLPTCTATITRIYEATGQARTLWSGSAKSGEPIVICGANNMSAKVMVTASISCEGNTTQNIEVTMPQWNSGTPCVSTDFCTGGTTSTTSTTVAPTTTTSTTAAPTTTTSTTAAPTTTTSTTEDVTTTTTTVE